MKLSVHFAASYLISFCGMVAISGVINAVNIVGGGLVTGVGQVLQGVVATPKAIISPAQGKWWNPNEGRWVETNLLDEERWITTQGSPYDEDILGDEVLPEDERLERQTGGKQVKDTTLYDLLGLDPSVDGKMVKRRYFIIARKYSPDRAGANEKSQKDFQQIGTAYMILTNEKLRAKYDRVGYDMLWEAEEKAPDVDPYLLYTCLFGSEKFQDYIGRLAAVTEVRVGDEETSKVNMEQARLLQKRRVTRLALALADRLSKWAEDDMTTAAKAQWMAEAETLTDASYGVELVRVIGQVSQSSVGCERQLKGMSLEAATCLSHAVLLFLTKVYSLSAVQFLGSFESGVGMPSISKWAQRQREVVKSHGEMVGRSIKAIGGDKERQSLEHNVGTAIDKSQGNALAEGLAKDILRKSALQAKALKILWQQTVVDITNTLHEAAQMVLHDRNVPNKVRKKRAEALECLGQIFQNENGKDKPIPEQAGLEEVAFHAMLETVWRKEMAARLETSGE
jgi:hypothetical protein